MLSFVNVLDAFPVVSAGQSYWSDIGIHATGVRLTMPSSDR